MWRGGEKKRGEKSGREESGAERRRADEKQEESGETKGENSGLLDGKKPWRATIISDHDSNKRALESDENDG